MIWNKNKSKDGLHFESYYLYDTYLALAEGEAGVDVLPVNSLQEGAAPVQRRLLLPRLEVTEQLTVHLHVRQQRLASNTEAAASFPSG